MQLESLFLDFCFFSFWFVLVSVFSLSFFLLFCSLLRRKVSDSREEVMQVSLTLIPSLPLLLFLIFSSFCSLFDSLSHFLWLLCSFLCISCLSFSDSCDLSSATIFIALFLLLLLYISLFLRCLLCHFVLSTLSSLFLSLHSFCISDISRKVGKRDKDSMSREMKADE